MGFREGLAVLIGIIIGSGIFRTPGKVLAACGTPGWTIAAWIVGGVLSFLGALVVAELCARLPRAGGTYAFLKEAYGKPLAFAFAATGVVAFKPLAIAGISRVCAEHLLVALTGIPASSGAVSIASVGLVLSVTVFNLFGTLGSARLQIAATAAKALVLVGVIMVAATRAGDGWGPVTGSASSPAATAFATALASVLWSYDGWADLGYMAGEVKDPRRTLPRLFAIGMIAVAALYVAANMAYLVALPADVMANGKTVAVDALSGLLSNSVATRVAAAAIALSTFGAVNASILSGGRIPYAAASDGLMPSRLARLDHRGTPRAALWLQGVLSAVLAWSATFEDLADAFVVTTWLFYVPMSLAAVTLRRRHGAPTKDSFSMPAYPWPIVIFVASALVFLTLRFMVDPLAKAAAGVAGLAVVLGYVLWGKSSGRGASNRGDPPPDLPESR